MISRKMLFIFIVFLGLPVFGIDFFTMNQAGKKDQDLLGKAGIKVLEKFENIPVDWGIGEAELFKKANSYLDEKHDLLTAFKIVSYLTLQSKKDEYMLLLGKCYYFIGEFYYEGYIRTYYQKAYDIFERLVDKNDENVDFLRWFSYASAKVGGFIKHKEGGKLDGLSYLKESVGLNDDILDINDKDEDALLTEAEYQIETDSIPLFGGTEKKGVELFHKVLSMNPNNLRVNVLLGKYLYRKKKDYANALIYLNKAVEIYQNKKCPQDMLHYYTMIFAEMHLIRVYKDLNRWADVWEHIVKHLSLLPRSPSGLKALRDYLFDVKKDKGNACEIAKRVLEMEPFGHEQDRKNQICQ
ncbi:MAG TPA: hypothetical protein DHW82_06525 [Spirochaetia bacterium]|nr:MAG: hypothetical protein A2Y41_03095 [Spirochaetes bacterium GWB1_36_13]HCL56648.1 hypothetical protein [Spirochaetia bacterium]